MVPILMDFPQPHPDPGPPPPILPEGYSPHAVMIGDSPMTPATSGVSGTALHPTPDPKYNAVWYLLGDNNG